MRFKDLTEDNIEYVKEVYESKNLSWDLRIQTLMKFFNKGEKRTREWLVKLGFKQRQKEDPIQYKNAKIKKINKKSKRFIVTWAQNNTPVHEIFLRNMEAYAKKIGAQIIVIAGRYQNPTSVFSDKNFESWHSRVEPYLYAGRESLHNHLVLVGDVKISPTASNPMTGMRGFSGSESCIFGHPKSQMETVPVLEGLPSKMMMTTGACTLANYTDSKEGKKGEFHHVLGFVVVEIKNNHKFFTRQVTATDDGNFYDLYYRTYFKGGFKKLNVVPGLTFLSDEFEGESIVEEINEIDAAILGDIHFGEHDQTVLDNTINVLFKKIKPKEVILHDIFNGHSISHHDRKDPFAQYRKEIEGKNDVDKEIVEMIEGLKPFADFKTIIARSNHDDFIDRWLRDSDWKRDGSIKNAPAYMRFSAMILDNQAPKGIIPTIVEKEYPEMITLGRSDSYRIHDWEVGQHGDIGASGSRGSVNQFKELNTKMIIGHSHSPSRKNGVIQVGTSTHLRVGYNIGPSGWVQTHAIVHADGKCQHVNFIGGEFTTFE